MRGIILPTLAAALLCGGCVQHYGDTSLYTLSGRQKPIVAILPVIDTTPNNLQWDLSQELTDEIRKKVYDSKKIYLLRDAGNVEIAKQLSTPNPLAISHSAIRELGAAEFAVVAEIIEQKETPYGIATASSQEPLGSVLNIALRIRVVDIRHETPKVILQEVLDQDYVVSRVYMDCDYEKMSWGTDDFSKTPMGIAHNRLIRLLVTRLEAYIEAA